MATIVNLNGQLAGMTGAGQLCGSYFNYTLSDQEDHTQVTASVGPVTVNKQVCLPVDQGPSGSQQTLFAAVSDAPVQIRLNASPDLVFNLQAGGPLIIGGQPEINLVELSGLGAVPASVTITKVVGVGTVPLLVVGAAGALVSTLEYLGLSSAGQTAFTLPSEPADINNLLFFVNGIMYSVASGELSISGTSVTWNNLSFVMPGGDRIEALYTTGSGGVAPYTLEPLAAAVAAQTAFTVSMPISDPSGVIFYVDGVAYTVASGEISVAGTSITWNNVSFVMVGGERIEVFY